MPRFETPAAAEAAFYEAFQDRALGAMMAVWALDDDIVCVHPNGPRLVGRRAVSESWKQIFDGDGPVRFTLSDRRATGDDDFVVHCLFEDLHFGGGLAQRARVVATNVYRRTEDGWRIVIHHASPGVVPGPPRRKEPERLH